MVVCNGEIYNYKKLYESIPSNPTTNSDCEIIIDLYLSGFNTKQIASMLDGVFTQAFIIYDLRKNIVMAGRDPFGVRPLYFIKKDDKVCFSSDLVQLSNIGKTYFHRETYILEID